MIEAEPSFGYRTVAALLGMNKNTVQLIFQLKGYQVRKRALGQRPRIEAKASRAERPDQRWATDLYRVWEGKDGWLSLALVDRLQHAAAARLAPITDREGLHRFGGPGTGSDQAVWNPWASPGALPAALGQWPGVHQS